MIPHLIPNIGKLERKHVKKVLMHGDPSIGDEVAQFESLVAASTRREWCVAVSSGTVALHIAMLVMHNESNIWYVPSYTFAATVNAMLYANIKPHFMDIDVYDLCAGPLAVGTEVLGNPNDGNVITDAACSIGRGRIGGKVACLSFNGNKTITTGGGGAVVGDDKDFEAHIRHLIKQANLGDYHYDMVGFNYRMPNINAALGVAQMKRLGEFIFRKLEISVLYKDALPNTIPHTHGSACWLSGYMSDTAAKDISLLREQGIEARSFWKPLHLQKPYQDFPRDDLPVTEEIWNRIVTLPSSTSLTEEQQNKVIEAVLLLQREGQTPRR